MGLEWPSLCAAPHSLRDMFHHYDDPCTGPASDLSKSPFRICDLEMVTIREEKGSMQ